MADTAQINYEHSDGNDLDFFTSNASIQWQFEKKEIARQNNKSGMAIDPNRVWRVVTCDAELDGDDVNTFNGWMMPASAPAYGGTYPKLTVYLDGDTTFTIFCMVTQAKATSIGHGKWNMNITFTEIE